MTLPAESTTAPGVVPPQPTRTTIQAPSKLPPPPPPPRREELRGSSAGLLRRAEGAGSAERSDRERDSDFSSLPIEPPALPDCATADGGAPTADRKTVRAIAGMTALRMRKNPK